MIQYILRRILAAIPMLWLGVTLTFFIMRLAPGDATTRYVNPHFPPEVKQTMVERFGLDEPIHVQYWDWLTAFVQGDFGISFTRSQPVSEVILNAMGNTLVLTGLSLMVAMIVGVSLGIVSAVKRHTFLDRSLSGLALFFYSMPGFWLALMLILLFALKLGWLPSGGVVSVNHELLTPPGWFWDRVVHLILPVFVLGVTSAATVMRYMRGSMTDILQQDFIRTARAKGLSERLVILRHAARNALGPVITLFGLSIPFLFSGAVIIEIVFSWPGMGRIMVESVLQRDYPVAIATAAIAFALVILGNLLSDVLYAIADPRVRYGEEKP